MKNNNKNNLILILSIMLFLLFIAFFLKFLDVIKNKNYYISQVIMTIDKKNLDKKNHKELEDKIIEIGGVHEKISSFFVYKSDIDSFLEYIERLGNNNLEIIVKSFDISKENKNIININVSLLGEFSYIMKTINLLENSPYKIIINSVYLNIDVKNQDTTNSSDLLNTKSLWQGNLTFSILSI